MCIRVKKHRIGAGICAVVNGKFYHTRYTQQQIKLFKLTLKTISTLIDCHKVQFATKNVALLYLYILLWHTSFLLSRIILQDTLNKVSWSKIQKCSDDIISNRTPGNMISCPCCPLILLTSGGDRDLVIMLVPKHFCSYCHLVYISNLEWSFQTTLILYLCYDWIVNTDCPEAFAVPCYFATQSTISPTSNVGVVRPYWDCH